GHAQHFGGSDMHARTSRRLAALAALAASSCFAPSSNAALLLSESFNYNSTTLSGQNGGTGWNGAWAASSGEVTLSNDGVSLTRADHLPSSGSRVADTDGATFTRLLASEARVNLDLT